MAVRNLLAIALMTTAVLADSPTSQPTTRPAAADSFDKGQFSFTDPPDGWTITRDDKDQYVLFTNGDRDGQIKLAIEPQGVVINGEMTAQVARQFVQTIKQARAHDKVEVVMPATIEKDKRFEIRIHEKYKVGDAVADQLHLYKTVGSRVLELTVSSTAADADKVTQTHKAGEDVLDGAKLVRPGKKKK